MTTQNRIPSISSVPKLALALGLLSTIAAAEPPKANTTTTTITTTTVRWSQLEYATAKAYTYNFEEAGPNAKGLYAYGPHGRYREPSIGMHPNIRNSRPLTPAEAQQALSLTQQTEGAARVSKCAFPRHAVVFFDTKGAPIASVNICFECGDILVYPEWDAQASEDKQAHRDDYTKRYDAAMDGWRSFFERFGTMPPDWKKARFKRWRPPPLPSTSTTRKKP